MPTLCLQIRGGGKPKCRVCERPYDRPKQAVLDKFAAGVADKRAEVAQAVSHDRREMDKLRKELAEVRDQLVKTQAQAQASQATPEEPAEEVDDLGGKIAGLASQIAKLKPLWGECLR